MKKIILLAMLCCISIAAVQAQKKGSYYAFKSPLTLVDEYNFATKQHINSINSVIKYAKEGIIFKVILVTTSEVIIQINDQKKPLTSPTGLHYLDSDDNGKFFVITLASFSEDCSDFEVKTTLNLSALVLPIKLRFGNKKGGDFEFTQNISLGGAIAIPICTTKNSDTFSGNRYSLITGVMASNVNADEKTVPGVYTAKTNVLALTLMFGLNVKRGKVAVGLVTGLDILTGEARRNWVYRKSPWLGLSIGTSLF